MFWISESQSGLCEKMFVCDKGGIHCETTLFDNQFV
jgi:hypothetical protein